MVAVIDLEDVSKRFRLGTRASLRDAAYRLSQRLRRPSKANDNIIWALNGVSFQVAKGEILGIIGPNGAGKTTVLKLLAGITLPTKGRISVKGRVGSLIQLGAGFHPDLTGKENIYLNGSILGLKKKEIDRKFNSIVAFSGLEQFIDTPVKRYSSGMYVRLGFAVAAHIEPEVLLIDEVLAVGDATFRQKCWKRIRELQNSDVSIVFVSHDLWSLKALVDRAILLVNGKILEQGKPQQVISTYESLIGKPGLLEMENVNDNSGIDLFHNRKKDQIEICDLKVLSRQGDENSIFSQDDRMIVKIKYIAHERVEQVGVSLRITRSDGISCIVSRTAHQGIEIDVLEGSGVLEIEINPLQLCSGNYFLQCRIVNSPPTFGYAYSLPCEFCVAGPTPNPTESPGVFFPLVEWRHNGRTLKPKTKSVRGPWSMG